MRKDRITFCIRSTARAIASRGTVAVACTFSIQGRCDLTLIGLETMTDIEGPFRTSLREHEHGQIAADAHRVHVVEDDRALGAEHILDVVLGDREQHVKLGILHQPVEPSGIEWDGGVSGDAHEPKMFQRPARAGSHMSRVRQDAVSSFSGKEVLHKQELRAVAADAGRVLVVPVYGVGFAEQAVVDESALAPKPPGLDHAHAAAIPLAGQTAWQGLYRHGGPKAGQAVLIHAGSAASAISPCSSPRRAAPGC